MKEHLTEDEKQLANLMSAISEKCYSAGWMVNTAYVLWEAVTTGPRNFGQDKITSEEIEKLYRLSDKTKTWIVFDEIKEETAIPLDKWRAQFTHDIAKDPNLLRG